MTEAELEARRARRLIHFAADGEDIAPGRLTRVPTPYPKELRALSKHSRNLKALKKEEKMEKGEEKENLFVAPQIKLASTAVSKILFCYNICLILRFIVEASFNNSSCRASSKGRDSSR